LIPHLQQATVNAVPLATETPRQGQSKPNAPAPERFATPTLHLRVGEHWLDVVESGVAGDVSLDGKLIMHRDLTTDGAPWADLLRYFGPIPPYEGVVLLSWRGPGNACNGYGFAFLSIRKDGTWQRADVPYCGGPPPIIVFSPTTVTIRIPPQVPNRGQGTIPAETWLYKDGVAHKVPEGAR
jgi:hypothetical protein